MYVTYEANKVDNPEAFKQKLENRFQASQPPFRNCRKDDPSLQEGEERKMDTKIDLEEDRRKKEDERDDQLCLVRTDTESAQKEMCKTEGIKRMTKIDKRERVTDEVEEAILRRVLKTLDWIKKTFNNKQ